MRNQAEMWSQTCKGGEGAAPRPGRRAVLLSAAGMALPWRGAHAAGFTPQRNIELLVGFVPGGTADAIARLLASEISSRHGWSCVTVNRPGGGGVLMQRALAGAVPDGHTLGVSASYQLMYTPQGMSAPPFGVEGFRQLASVAASPMALVAKVDGPCATFEQLKAHARSKGAVSLALSPPFTWLGDRLGAELGINIISVPFKGAGESLPATTCSSASASMAGTR